MPYTTDELNDVPFYQNFVTKLTKNLWTVIKNMIPEYDIKWKI